MDSLELDRQRANLYALMRNAQRLARAVPGRVPTAAEVFTARALEAANPVRFLRAHKIGLPYRHWASHVISELEFIADFGREEYLRQAGLLHDREAG